MRPRTDRQRFNPVHLAGWLFADMLLVLAVVAMGSQGDPLGVAAAAKPKSDASASSKPAHTGPRQVQRKSKVINLGDIAGSSTESIVRRIKQRTSSVRHRQVAFVFVWGHNHNPGIGGTNAERIDSLLNRARPEMFKGAAKRDYWKGDDAHPTRIHLEIFFYTY